MTARADEVQQENKTCAEPVTSCGWNMVAALVTASLQLELSVKIGFE